MEDDDIMSGEKSEQLFTVKIVWPAESGYRITEGDILESLEMLVMDMEEEATVEVIEHMSKDIG